MATDARNQLLTAIPSLTDQKPQEVLDFLILLADPGTLSKSQMARIHRGEEEIRRGEFVTLDDLRRKLGR